MEQESVSADLLLRILDQMPGVPFASRVDLTTGKMEWLYVSPRMAELHGVSESVLHENPGTLIARIVDEDRGQFEQLMAVSLQTLEPLHWTGRIQNTAGEPRWIQTQTVYERAPDGAVLGYGHAIDVTEKKRTEAALEASEGARRESESMHRAVIDALPVGVSFMDLEHQLPIFNPTAQRLTGRSDRGEGDFNTAFGLYNLDGVTLFPEEDMPGTVAQRDRVEVETEMLVRNESLAAPVRLLVKAQPMYDPSGKLLGALVVTQDFTLQRGLEEELRRRNEQLAASEEVKTTLIDRLRYAIDELSNPILEVWDDVLVIPIIGVVDSRRTADMVKRLLAEVTRTQASFVIVDLTGVEIVDTKTADHLMKLVRKVEIVGARCVLTGIRPAVSETLVDIGVDLGRLTTLRNLKHGLRAAMRFDRHERTGAREVGDADERAERPQPRRL